MQQLQQGDDGSLEEKVWTQAAPPQITQRHVQGDAPHNHPNRAAARPAPRSARALILLSRPSPPTWELPPSLPHPPISATYRSPQQKMHGELRVGARVSERRPPEFLSAHTHMLYWVPSTVNGVLGWNLALFSRINVLQQFTVLQHLLWIPTSFGFQHPLEQSL